MVGNKYKILSNNSTNNTFKNQHNLLLFLIVIAIMVILKMAAISNIGIISKLNKGNSNLNINKSSLFQNISVEVAIINPSNRFLRNRTFHPLNHK